MLHLISSHLESSVLVFAADVVTSFDSVYRGSLWCWTGSDIMATGLSARHDVYCGSLSSMLLFGRPLGCHSSV